MIGRRRSRSTHTPATRPKTKRGRKLQAPRMPIWTASAPTATAAVSCKARMLMWKPSDETNPPVHNFRNSGSPSRERIQRPYQSLGMTARVSVAGPAKAGDGSWLVRSSGARVVKRRGVALSRVRVPKRLHTHSRTVRVTPHPVSGLRSDMASDTAGGTWLTLPTSLRRDSVAAPRRGRPASSDRRCREPGGLRLDRHVRRGFHVPHRADPAALKAWVSGETLAPGGSARA